MNFLEQISERIHNLETALGIIPTASSGNTVESIPFAPLPSGIIGYPNSDLVVKIQSVEDARAKWINDTTENNALWAKYLLPHWWAVDEVARAYHPNNIVAQYIISSCNQGMLMGALNGNNFNTSMWHPWVNRPGSTVVYSSWRDVGVVAGPNNFGALASTGFPGIKIADMPALIEANRVHINSLGPLDQTALQI